MDSYGSVLNWFAELNCAILSLHNQWESCDFFFQPGEGGLGEDSKILSLPWGSSTFYIASLPGNINIIHLGSLYEEGIQ